jgi:PIN domain nuclease of toxin-antitoxin system
MKLLLDTHVALWLFNEYEKLSPVAEDCLRNDNNELYISIVSAWEVAIKHILGKLTDFPEGVRLVLSEIYKSPIEIVGILSKYVVMVEELPYIHRDPFDRLIISTALCENMTVLTADENIPKYDIRCYW